MKKILREEVWKKYNKRCAYCGKILKYKELQVDHKRPKKYGGAGSKRNLMPSCRRCNHYKRAHSLERFRTLMKTLHERIQKQYISKVAIDYKIIKIKPFSGIFYFEKTKKSKK